MKRQRSKMCKRCGMGSILYGHSSQYNCKSSDGTVVCANCKAKEQIAEAYEKVRAKV